jgi:hypothetical protein
MKVHVLKPIRVMGMGLIPAGRTPDLPECVVKPYLRQGAVELYETKVIRENPTPAAGAPSSASPAVRVSPQTTSSVSGRGGRKKRKGGRSS